MNVNIYVLIDPRSLKVRYIGRTTQSLQKRLNGHINKSKKENNHKSCWIKSLLKINKKPIIKLIKVVKGWENSYKIERIYIKTAIKNNYDLTNLDDRGIGGKNKVLTLEQRLKISNTLKLGYEKGLIKPTNTTPVFVFDLFGTKLYNFYSCSECIKVLNISRSTLENVLSLKQKRWKNYQITYGNNPGIYTFRSNYTQNNKEIFIFDISNLQEMYFNSFKSAATFLNVSSPTIRRYVNKVFRNKFFISNARLKLDEFKEKLEVVNFEPSLS